MKPEIIDLTQPEPKPIELCSCFQTSPEDDKYFFRPTKVLPLYYACDKITRLASIPSIGLDLIRTDHPNNFYLWLGRWNSGTLPK